MIPKITQKGPSIMEQYWCGHCGAGLPNPCQFRGNVSPKTWNFCPICGEPIEYDKAEHVQWSEQNCERCDSWLIMKRGDGPRSYFIANCNYVGARICRTCMEEHCVQTNCLQCEIGKWPDCPYDWVKKSALKRNDNT
mgnify:CR=1 FL=1